MALPTLAPEVKTSLKRGTTTLAAVLTARRWAAVLLVLAVAAWLTWRGLNPVHGAVPPAVFGG